MRHKALLLDLDGTLVRTDSLHRALWKEILASYGIHLTIEEYEQRVTGRDDAAIWQEWNVGTQEERQVWNVWKQEEFMRRIHETEPVPGGKERIQEWNDAGFGHWVGIVTHSNRVTANALLVHLGVVDFVDVLITSDCECAPKPSPEPYYEALRELGVEPENAVIVENSDVGIESARQVGVSSIFRVVRNNRIVPAPNESYIPILDFTDNQLSPSVY